MVQYSKIGGEKSIQKFVCFLAVISNTVLSTDESDVPALFIAREEE